MLNLIDYIKKTNILENNSELNHNFVYLDDLLESVTESINESQLEFNIITEAGEQWSIKDGYYVKQNGDVLLFPDRKLYDKQNYINKKSRNDITSKSKHLYNYLLWAGNHAMERHNERKVTIDEIVECVKEAYPKICELYRQGKLEQHNAKTCAVIIKYQGENEPPISVVVFVERNSKYNKETNKYEEYPTLEKRTPTLKIKTVAKYYDFASIFRPDGKRKEKDGGEAYEYHIFLDQDGRLDPYKQAKEAAIVMRDNNKEEQNIKKYE